MASALPTHGDAAPALADALAHAHAPQALLPLPEDAAHADALRALAQDDPVTARRLAQALRGRSWRDALDWQALDNAARRVIGAVVDVAPPDADPLAVHDPIAALALTALTARRARIRTIWGQLPSAVQQSLGAIPDLADRSQSLARPAIRRGLRR